MLQTHHLPLVGRSGYQPRVSPEFLSVPDSDDINKYKLFLLAPLPGPNGDADEDDGRNDPDNKIGCWEYPSFCCNLYESNNAGDDYNDGQY
jgi:hypothetical protein